MPLKLDKDGLVTVAVQDRLTGELRMVAHATPDAVRATLVTGRATFWSRSRGELWEKGAASGNGIKVERVLVDCDADCLVYVAEPQGPSCHTGAASCFFQRLDENGEPQGGGALPPTALARLEETLLARKSSTAGASYTKTLYDGGAPAIGAKIEEEATELAAALAAETDVRVVNEAADVLYHVMVGLAHRGIAWREVLRTLDERAAKSGHAEKAARV